MKSLKRYAYLNALLRARLSRRLGAVELDALADAPDASEVASLLKNTDYRELSPLIESGSTLKIVEKILLKIEIGRYRSALRHAHGAVANLIFSLMELYDVGKVQGLLRIWKEREIEERDIIFEEKICWHIPVDKILNATSMEEIILLLDSTPFKEALMSGYERYRRSGRLFPLETALEADYFHRLWETIEKLSAPDRLVASRMVGIEIDIRNLESLARLKRYGGLPASDARDLLLPGGFNLSEQRLLDAYSSRDPKTLIAMLGTIPPSVTGSTGGERVTIDQLRLIHAFLEDVLERDAQRALGGYPFTIGTVIAYFMLMRVEAHTVRRIIAGKYLGLPAERITSSFGTGI